MKFTFLSAYVECRLEQVIHYPTYAMWQYFNLLNKAARSQATRNGIKHVCIDAILLIFIDTVLADQLSASKLRDGRCEHKMHNSNNNRGLTAPKMTWPIFHHARIKWLGNHTVHSSSQTYRCYVIHSLRTIASKTTKTKPISIYCIYAKTRLRLHENDIKMYTHFLVANTAKLYRLL